MMVCPVMKSAGARGEQQRHPSNVLGLAEAPQSRRNRRRGFAGGATLRVLVKHAGELGLDESRGYAIDLQIVWAPFGGEIAAQGVIGMT
jgi:hypothetical protein